MDKFELSFDMVKSAPRAPGIRVQVIGDDGFCRSYISAYNELGAEAAVGRPLMLSYDKLTGDEMVAPATTGSEVYVYTGVPTRPVPDKELDWFQIGGPCKGLVDGTADVTAGDALEVLNAGVAFIKAGSARDLSTAALASVAQAANSAVLVDIMLIPERHSIEAA